ncbi:MAG: NAD(P)H-binding protein [Bacteroidota bacterium]
MSQLFITGATGTVGQEVITALSAKGFNEVTAASRNASPVAGAQAVAFNYDDPATFSTVSGHTAVFLVGPPLNPGLFEQLEPFVDYLAANGRPRVVYLSGNGMQDMPALPFHGRMEEKLAQSGLGVTVLRPGFFATNFANYERENIEQRGMLFNPAGHGKTTFIDPRDIGAVAAEVLLDERHVGKTYTLTGTQAYEMNEVAQKISALTNQPISFPAPSNEVYRQVLLDSGTPAFIADYMIPIYNLIRDGKAELVTTDVEDIIGWTPTSLDEVLQRSFQATA